MKVAITGASSGIGAAVARRLKADGHHVTAFDIAAPDEVDRWVPVDLSDRGSIARALGQAEGPYDALLNNAGLPPRAGDAARVLMVNFLGLRIFLDGMLDHMAPGGSIVNTASRAGAAWRENLEQVKALLALGDDDDPAAFVAAQGIDDVRAYNLSKEALIVLTLARTEAMIARGLRINSVSPAAVSTGILDDFVAAFGDRVARNIARAGRPGLADEVASVITFLASPESGWLKGVDIVIDGGMTAMTLSDQLDLSG